MVHRAWSSIEEVPYCFSRSYVKSQGHTALKIVDFDPNWAFPDCYSSLNSPMAMKCCTKLETAKKRCPIVFQGHPSNFKVTRDKTSPILTQIGRFRTICRSQLSNPSDLPCCWIECYVLPFVIDVFLTFIIIIAVDLTNSQMSIDTYIHSKLGHHLFIQKCVSCLASNLYLSQVCLYDNCKPETNFCR